MMEYIFGTLEDPEIMYHTVVNDAGMSVTAINYGCTITSIMIPDSEGNMENVVLGFDTFDEYIKHSPFFGCTVGRVAGRISNGSFEMDGQAYQLTQNEGSNHHHGGIKGLDKYIWDASVEQYGEESISIVFSTTSKDGLEGYPGNIQLKVYYTLNQQNELEIRMEGISDKKTIINLTNHTYFNLSGNLKRDILDHQLTIDSDHFLELNKELLPTGKLVSVQDTVFDFREGRVIQDGVNSNHEQNILAGHGYDHPFVLDGEVKLFDNESGRVVTIETNQPSVVLYTANHLGTDYSIRGVQSRPHLGLCLETQGYPDAVNHEQFPSIVVEKDELYQSITRLKFEVNK